MTQEEGLPDGAKSLALLCEDPDAPRGTWTHWVLWNLAATTRELAQGQQPDPDLPYGAKQGKNDFPTVGYKGPCPPSGPPHRYYFRLFALDAMLHPPAEATAAELRRAMEGHILGAGAIMGTYKRASR